MDTLILADAMLFLSTLSLRRATISCQYLSSDFWNFYPRSPCGERPVHQSGDQNDHEISIHALLAESDLYINRATKTIMKFLSTLSLRRATHGQSITLRLVIPFLSTLSLRRATCPPIELRHERGFLSTLSLRRATSVSSVINNVVDDFYPRSPCGERRVSSVINNVVDDFYPRSPCGERQ